MNDSNIPEGRCSSGQAGSVTEIQIGQPSSRKGTGGWHTRPARAGFSLLRKWRKGHDA